jgi:hypothetical protein
MSARNHRAGGGEAASMVMSARWLARMATACRAMSATHRSTDWRQADSNWTAARQDGDIHGPGGFARAQLTAKLFDAPVDLSRRELP